MKKEEWFEANAPGLPWSSKHKLSARKFASEEDLLRSVEASRRAHRSAPKAAATRKRNQEKQRRELRDESIRDACATWDEDHRGDAAVRAKQSPTEKRRARVQTSEAIESRQLAPVTRWLGTGAQGKNLFAAWCQRCYEEFAKVEAHHTDYSKPLEVEWLCPGCHASIHIREFDRSTWLQLFEPRVRRKELDDLAAGVSPRCVANELD